MFLNPFQYLGLLLLVSEPTGLFGFFCSLFSLCSITWRSVSCSSSDRDGSSVATRASISLVNTWGEERRRWRPCSFLNKPSSAALCSVFPCPSLRWNHDVMTQFTKNILSVTSSASRTFCDRSTNVLSVSYTVHMRFVRYTSITHTAKSVG